MTRLSIYDLDRTITRIPTWSPFLLQAAWMLAPWRIAAVPLLAPIALLRGIGLIHRDDLKQAMHRLLIGERRPAADLARVADAFAERFVVRNVYEGARRQMKRDRAEGRRIVIATAAHRFYAEPIARRLGVEDLIATEARRGPGGEVLSAIDGANCYGAAKLAGIRAWLAAEGWERGAVHIRFYSDHASDQPTLDWVDEPVAVNPHAPLARLARERGWAMMDWRGAGQRE